MLNQSPDAAFPGFKRTWNFVVTPLDQLRLRLTDHDFDRLMQAAKPSQRSNWPLCGDRNQSGRHSLV